MKKRVIFGVLVAFALVVILPGTLRMARKNKGPDPLRSAAVAEELAPNLYLQWVRHLPALKPAWPDQPMLQFDNAYQPVVHDRVVLLASSREDSITAYDTRTGEEKWRFVTDGPVRFAPLVWRGRAYVVSDDGYLYCLDAEEGLLLWKRRGGPSERKILGNERLISTWPARGAPVIVKGKVYFAASIWPFMGVFLHGLEATSGKSVWTNDGDGSIYIAQPHHADSFGGVAPQGYLAAVNNRLLIPGGRSVPACLDLDSGKMVHYRLADYSGAGRGGWKVAAQGAIYHNAGALFDIETGDQLERIGDPAVLTPDLFYGYAEGHLQAYQNHFPPTPARTIRGETRPREKLKRLASIPTAPLGNLLKAGSRLYGTSGNRVVAYDLPLRDGNDAVAWESTIEGQAATLAIGDERLYVTTREGTLYCFGPDSGDVKSFAVETVPIDGEDEWDTRAAAILEQTSVREGYCVAWGAGSGRLIAELAKQSKLHIVAVDSDGDRVERVREELRRNGIYGTRVSVHHVDWTTLELPPYFASLMVAEELPELSEPQWTKAFTSLRPHGGVACLPGLSRELGEKNNLKTTETREWLLLRREGGIPGAADWTHEHGDAANTRVSRDSVVRAPLGLLWFGGSTNDAVLPRHGHGPQPQVVMGRLIIEGVDGLRAVDIYTGRVLWEAVLPELGKVFDNTHHHPGANATGANYISTPDGIYVLYGTRCLLLDLQTGKLAREFNVPISDDDGEPCVWGYINVGGDYLVGGLQAAVKPGGKHPGLSSSKHLVVLDRHSGKLLWHRIAANGFRHNAICLGPDRLFCIDRVSEDHLPWQKKQAESARASARLHTLDARTGSVIWSAEDDIFGTSLSFSADHNVLVETGRVARDTLYDEAGGMRAYEAKSGAVLWMQKDYAGPAMIADRKIFKNSGACDLLTGAVTMRRDPLTGKDTPWTWKRGYGCNTPLASTNLLTFRSGAAGFFDLAQDGGTGNFGGFRSGCTNNLIVAGGVLVAPDYTRTCTCSYQNQTSLALVHMPDAEMWTYFTNQQTDAPIRRVGLNLGAPGDRMASDGTLWLEYPSVGGPSPVVAVKTRPEQPQFFRRHSSQVQGPMPWVAASGAKGLSSLTLTLSKTPRPARKYTVRLHFAEPDELKAGERVFHVTLQSRRVLKSLDVAQEAGGPNRALVKEFKGILVADHLTLTMVSASSRSAPTLLCGIELFEE